MAAKIRTADNATILESRIRGERIIAIVRLFVLTFVALLMVYVFFNSMNKPDSIKKDVIQAFIVEIIALSVAVGASLWVLRITKRGQYYSFMKYALPFIDITLLSISNYANAVYPGSGFIITGAPSWFYFSFIILTVLRNSPSSVLFTGIYAAVSYFLLSVNAQSELKVFKEGGAVFSNIHGEKLFPMMDDETIKPIIMLLSTGVLTYIAHRFNKMVVEQTRLRAEREETARELNIKLREITQGIMDSGGVLESTARKLTSHIDELQVSTRGIGEETRQEYGMIENSSASVAQMIQSVESMAGSLSRQADTVSESFQLMAEMEKSVKSVRERARNADEIARNLLGTAEQGEKTVQDVVAAVMETDRASREIREVLSIITGIAEQTNMLAMNAAIEAAHAGEAGKGFAIVAAEIRNLAEQSAQNADKISHFMKDIADRVDRIVKLSGETSSRFDSILTDTRSTTQVNSAVLAAMNEETELAREAVHKIQDLKLISDELRAAGSEQAVNGRQVLSSIIEMRTKADNVRRETEHQVEKGNGLSLVNNELREVIQRNVQVLDKLEELVSRF